MSRSATIELHREALRFSAGHLMLLSADTRETLHGHDYQVSVALQTDPGSAGFAVDLRSWRETVQTLCDRLDFRFLVPGTCPFLLLTDTKTHWNIQFKNQTFQLLKEDVVILPMPNITLEELSAWFIGELTREPETLAATGIRGIQVTVFNGRSESSTTHWSNDKN